ncbi:MAG: hypothetical protein MHPSP_001809, partial [Paramarteilia canceri]
DIEMADIDQLFMLSSDCISISNCASSFEDDSTHESTLTNPTKITTKVKENYSKEMKLATVNLSQSYLVITSNTFFI